MLPQQRRVTLSARVRWVRRCSSPTVSLHPTGVLRALVDFTEPLGASIFPSPRWGRSAHFFHKGLPCCAPPDPSLGYISWAPRDRLARPGPWGCRLPGRSPQSWMWPPVHPDPASPSERLLCARPEPLLLPTYVGGTHTRAASVGPLELGSGRLPQPGAPLTPHRRAGWRPVASLSAGTSRECGRKGLRNPSGFPSPHKWQRPDPGKGVSFPRSILWAGPSSRLCSRRMGRAGSGKARPRRAGGGR